MSTTIAGICACGCGEATRRSKKTNAARGHRVGEFVRYRVGHAARRTPLQRFLAHVDKNGPVPAHMPDLGPCWLWTGTIAWTGYGALPVKGVTRVAHRFAYLHFVGDIPSDRPQLDHLCRVRRCVNPGHLEPVTARENVRRGSSPFADRARQTACIHGHALDERNTRIRANGTRQCRVCDRQRRRARLASQRLARQMVDGGTTS